MGLFKLLQFTLLLEVTTIVLGQPMNVVNSILSPDQLLSSRVQQLLTLRSKIQFCSGQLICGARSVAPFTTDVSCVPIPQICNSVADCSTYADETECPINCHGKVRCSDDCTCAIPCDGITQCPSGEDEADCSPECNCGPSFYLCSDKTRCIPRSAICNRIIDCPSGDDESGCNSICRCNPGFAACSDGHTCIQATQVCNNVPDECPDNEDETSCPIGCQCASGALFCPNGERCVANSQICNGVPNECCDGDADACSPNLNEDEQCLSIAG